MKRMIKKQKGKSGLIYNGKTNAGEKLKKLVLNSRKLAPLARTQLNNYSMFKNKKTLFLIIIIIAIGFIIYDSTSLPTVNDLKGNFKEVAVYRNENNTGPIKRVYAVTVEGQVWEEMEKYGELMPYTKYGSTTVYFFDASKPAPDKLAATEPHFASNYNVSCVAVYSKDPNGGVSFKKSPF